MSNAHTSRFITACSSEPHPLGPFVNLLSHLAIVYQQCQKRPTEYSQQVNGSHPSPLFSACETASGALCLIWNRRSPEVPSNSNYSVITKVLLYLTPCIACFITQSCLLQSFTTYFVMEGGARQEREEHALEMTLGSRSATNEAHKRTRGEKRAIQVNAD